MVESKETFFTQTKAAFPAPTENNEIDATTFLEASSHLARFFGILGTVFTPVESDISGNVKKLQKYIEKQPEEIKHLNNVVETPERDLVAIDALLWLKRALEFTLTIMQQIVTATRNGTATEDLRPICLDAYENSLKKYHGWLAQQVFNLVSRACPYRKDLLTSLALGNDGMEDVVIDQMEQILVNLKRDVEIIDQLYAKHNLDSDAKV